MSKLTPSNQFRPVAASTDASKSRRDLPLGTATWQTPNQGATQEYRPGNFLLGYAQGNGVSTRDDRQTLLVAGPRGGKGISVIIPNLLVWQGSVIVLDPKGENAMITARRRGNGSAYSTGKRHKVHILDPFNTVKTKLDNFADLKRGFNPLTLIDARRSDAVNIAGLIADAIIVSENSKDPFWEEAARSLLRGLILYVATSIDFLPHERNLITVRKLIMAGAQDAKKLAALNGDEDASSYKLLADAMQRSKALDGAVAEAGAALEDLCRSDKTRLSVMQVARTNLDFIADPEMKACLARSDFALSDLKTDPQGISLYICLPQRYMGTHHRWLRMMTSLTIGEMERVSEQPACGHRVLMVLDEFAGLKRMPVIENAAAQIAGFGVKMLIVVQSLAQLKGIYQDSWETLVANCATKMFFSNDDHFTREYASKLVGDCEVVRTTRSTSRTRGTSSSNTHGTTIGETFSVTSGFSSNASYGTVNGSHSYGRSGGSSQSFSSGKSYSSTMGTNESDTAGFAEAIHKRPLITPDEVGRLFGDANDPMTLTLIAGQQPMALRRKSYFRISGLQGFFDPHPDHPVPPTLEMLAAARLRQNLVEKELQERQEQARLLKAEQEREAAIARFNAQQHAEYAAKLRRFQQAAAADRQRRRQQLWWRIRLAMMVMGLSVIAWLAWIRIFGPLFFRSLV